MHGVGGGGERKAITKYCTGKHYYTEEFVYNTVKYTTSHSPFDHTVSFVLCSFRHPYPLQGALLEILRGRGVGGGRDFKR